jgi:Domain of unknown function (DUF1992)
MAPLGGDHSPTGLYQWDPTGLGQLAQAASVGGYAGTMEALALLAESKIRAAMAEGKFDALPGRGRPLPADDLGRVPPELRMGFKLLRNAGCLPPEIEARKEAARLGTLIAATGDATERKRLSRLRAEADLRYRLLVERRSR